MGDRLEKYFGLRVSGSTIRREVVGGVTIFSTASYIDFVQPAVLNITGLDFESVLRAACVSSAIACFLTRYTTTPASPMEKRRAVLQH